MNRTVVVYHKNCADGACAAAVVLLSFPHAEPVALAYGEEPPEVDANTDLYIVDFSFSRDTLLELHRVARSVLVLDHHKTAAAALAGLPFARFRSDACGASMAWDELNPKKPRPWVVRYVEDHDLWRFQLPQSYEVRAFLRSVPTDPHHLGAWEGLLGSMFVPSNVYGSGAAILQFVNAYCREVSETAVLGTLGGFVVPIVNAPNPMTSDLLAHMLDGNPYPAPDGAWPFAAKWQKVKGRYLYSLRSTESGIDVSSVALAFGGGGHKHAAGFAADEAVHTAL